MSNSMKLRIKREQLKDLVREIGLETGEEKQFLDNYIEDLLKEWSNSVEKIDKAIDCFVNIMENIENIIGLREGVTTKRPGSNPYPRKLYDEQKSCSANGAQGNLTLNEPFLRFSQ